MEISFPRYLASKRSVDDRALNRRVWNVLYEQLSGLMRRPSIYVLELGGGIGTMFERMVEWGALANAEYSLIDEQAQNITAGLQRISRWATRQEMASITYGKRLFLHGADHAFQIDFYEESVEAFIERETGKRSWDLIVGNAFLDLVDVPVLLETLKPLLLPGGLLYFTINFDGLTAFEPEVNPEFDQKILELYHRTMDERWVNGNPSGGSHTGRRLLNWLKNADLQILAAGSSDWLVYPSQGRYAHDEAYFLHFILHFFEQSLKGHAELDEQALNDWLELRRRQIDRGELTFIAHQFDFLAQAL